MSNFDNQLAEARKSYSDDEIATHLQNSANPDAKAWLASRPVAGSAPPVQPFAPAPKDFGTFTDQQSEKQQAVVNKAKEDDKVLGAPSWVVPAVGGAVAAAALYAGKKALAPTPPVAPQINPTMDLGQPAPVDPNEIRAQQMHEAKLAQEQAKTAQIQAKTASIANPNGTAPPAASASPVAHPAPPAVSQLTDRIAQGKAAGLDVPPATPDAPQTPAAPVTQPEIQSAAADASITAQAQPTTVPPEQIPDVVKATVAQTTPTIANDAFKDPSITQGVAPSATTEAGAVPAPKGRPTNAAIAAANAAAPEETRPQYSKSVSSPLGPGAYNHLYNNQGTMTEAMWKNMIGDKNVSYAEYEQKLKAYINATMAGGEPGVFPDPANMSSSGNPVYGKPKYIPKIIQGAFSPSALAATAATATATALASAGYNAYKGNKSAVYSNLNDAWESLKSTATFPYQAGKSALKGDFGPIKDMLMSSNPATLLMNESNKNDDAIIQGMIKKEKAAALARRSGGGPIGGVPPP